MGFKMRSGNGPLQFKQMGATPVKQGLSGYDVKTEDEINQEMKTIESKKIETIPSKEPEMKPIEATKTFKETSAEIKAEKKAYTDSKHKGQLKKEKRLKKITERRERKGKKGLTSRQMELQRRVDQTPEEFVAERKAKRQEIGKGLQEAGYLISSAYGPGGTGSTAVSAQKLEQQKKDNESQRLTDKIKDINIKNYKKGEMETDATKPAATTTTPEGETTANTSSVSEEYGTAEKARQKSLTDNEKAYDTWLRENKMSGDRDTYKMWLKSGKEDRTYGI